MSLLGKVLALLNVLAAVGFFYLATADRAKRQSWAYAVYRHQLAIDGLVDLDPLITHGLPLDDYPDALDMIRRGDGLKIQLLPNG